MRRILAAALALALSAISAPAWATTLLTLPITTAVTAQTTTPVQFPRGRPISLAVQAKFTYGSGGTSADAYVQTSFDGGITWADIANFHFTTSSAKFIYNLSALTAKTTEVVPSDGSLTANTSVDGIIGGMVRVKYTTVGTYATSTVMQVDVASNVLSPAP